MAAASSSVQALPSSFSWPENLNEVGLTHKEIDTIEKIIRIYRECCKTSNSFVSINRDSHVQGVGRAPRRIVVYKDRSIVVLNSKGGLQPIKGGVDQPKMKLAYDPDNGKMCLKKRVSRIAELGLLKMIFSGSRQGKEGFSNILHIEEREGKMRYFETLYFGSLQKFLTKANSKKTNLNLKCLIQLQNALKWIHSIKYQPMEFISFDGKASSFEFSKQSYHGDISPNNIVCKLDDQGFSSLHLIDWSASLDENRILRTLGWASPEVFKCPLKPAEFNAKYGCKKDAWAFGLLAGSLMRGHFYCHPSNRLCLLPNFSFLINKIEVDDLGKIDDSKIAEITQKEVDEEIDGIINALSEAEKVRGLHYVWETIKTWTKVDPDERKTVAESYIS